MCQREKGIKVIKGDFFTKTNIDIKYNLFSRIPNCTIFVVRDIESIINISNVQIVKEGELNSGL